MRQKEWWGNNTVDPTNIDSLEITTRSGGETERAGNIINAATAPYTGSLIAVITFDNNVDGVTDTTAPVPVQPPFISGFDAYMPATEPPDGTIRFRHEQRQTERTGQYPQHPELVVGGRARHDRDVPGLGPGHRHVERVQAGSAQPLRVATSNTLGR